MNIFDMALRRAVFLGYSHSSRLGSLIPPAVREQALILLASVDQQRRLVKTEFTEDGFEVFPRFLTLDTCDFLRERLDHYLHDMLPAEETKAYIVERRRQPLDGYDRNVFQMMNIQNLPEMSELCESLRERLEGLLQERTGLKVYCNTFSLQRDFPDDESKRPYHNDSYGLTFKAFIYLTDVPERKNGPFTVVPGSHRDLFERLRCIHKNEALKSQRYDDVYHAYDDRNAVSFCEPKGTMILSTQTIAHKGWHEHTEGVRDVLAVYIHVHNIPDWTLGKNLTLREPLRKASLV
jgi:hypothetical protein